MTLAVGVVAGRGNPGGGRGGRSTSNNNSISTGILERFYLWKAAKILVFHDSISHDVVEIQLQCNIQRSCRSLVCTKEVGV